MGARTRELGIAIRFVWMLAFAVSALLGCENVDRSAVVDFSERSEPGAIDATTSPKTGESERVFLFGFDARSTVKEDARQYLPLLHYLEQETGYRYQLVLTMKGDRLAEKLGRGEVDFASIGAVSFITSREKYAIKPLVRGLNSSGKAEYQSVFVVKADSDIRNIRELRGRRVAFGNEDSTQGHLIPRIELKKVGIELDALGAYDYLGSHAGCANGVISGQFDACGMQDTMGMDLESDGLVRIIDTSDFYPSSGIAAAPGVSPEVLEKTRAALIRFDPKGKHQEGLYNWDKTEMPNGFKETHEQDYRSLRAAMQDLGMLKQI